MFTFLIITFFMFAADLLIYYCCALPLSFGLLALFFTALFAEKPPWPLLGFVAILLCCQSFAITGSLSYPFFIELPIALIIRLVRPFIYPHQGYPIAAIGLSIMSRSYLLKPYFNLIGAPKAYTVGIFFGIVICVWLFSLKFKMGKTRQSLMPFAWEESPDS
jgi:hypothetical protein